jgi:hypothetical protein
MRADSGKSASGRGGGGDKEVSGEMVRMVDGAAAGSSGGAGEDEHGDDGNATGATEADARTPSILRKGNSYELSQYQFSFAMRRFG